MKQIFVIGSILGVTCGTTHYSLKTLSKNHDAAFCALLTEIWKDENEKDIKKIHDYQKYLETNPLHMIINRPPHDAYDRFKDIDLKEFDAEVRMKVLQKYYNLLGKHQ